MLGLLDLSLRVGLSEAYEGLYLPCKVSYAWWSPPLDNSVHGELGLISSLVASWMHLLGEAKKCSHFGDSPYGHCTI